MITVIKGQRGAIYTLVPPHQACCRGRPLAARYTRQQNNNTFLLLLDPPPGEQSGGTTWEQQEPVS